MRKGIRINYQFMGITTFENGWWYNENLKQWEHNPNMGKYQYSTHQPCRTKRAFRRKIKKAPQGVKFILVSRWCGYDIEGTNNIKR